MIERDCTGCGICADLCPHAAICQTRGMAYPAGVPGACVGCMLCVQQCPIGAIEVRS